LLGIKDNWLALRVRTMLVAYVEDWMEDKRASTTTVVQTENLMNLQGVQTK